MTVSSTSIPLDVFWETVPISDAFESIVTKLDKYRCFVTNGGERERGIETGNGGNASNAGRARHFRRGGGGAGRQLPVRMRQERPRIGIRELSREDMCKKEFLSLTNKVSPQNKDSIVKKMIAGLAPQYACMYCKVLWSIMQRPVQIYQNIYAEFARIVAVNTPMPNKLTFKGAWESCWREVTEGEKALINVPTMFNDVTDEGVFHEWSVWKKCRINLVKGCIFLCYHGVFTKPPIVILEPIMLAVDKALEDLYAQSAASAASATSSSSPIAAHIIDYWLEILSVSWNAENDIQQPMMKIALQKLNHWYNLSTNLPPKCRFKIESLKEVYCK